MIKSPISPLYKGLTRIFILIAVVWTGMILFWIRDENFNVVRPNEKMVERVDDWLVGIDYLHDMSNLPSDRRQLIQKALNTGTYLFDGTERKLTTAELKGCQTILENGFSPQVKEAIVMAHENAEAGRSLASMDGSQLRYHRTDTRVWDFRGVSGLNLESLQQAVRGTVFWLNEIQTFEGMEKHFVFGMVKKYKPSGEFTGLVTEEDFALQADLWKAQHDRRFLKPLFWVAAGLIPLLGLLIAGVVGVELVRWIRRGFQHTH